MKRHALPTLAAALLIGSASIALAQQSGSTATSPSSQPGAASTPSMSSGSGATQGQYGTSGSSATSKQQGLSGSTGSSSGTAGSSNLSGSPGSSGATVGQSGTSGTSGSTAGATVSGQGANIQSASGEVDKIDKDKKTLTLKDGNTYKLSDTASIKDIEKGDKVNLTYRKDGDDRRAMTVTESVASGSSGSSDSASSGSDDKKSDKK